ncbi:MAG: hypothetical protein KAS67_06795 [Thermoplasmata archaeon]|nr:hypothetical protein [Thermoplasmata archaeon]
MDQRLYSDSEYRKAMERCLDCPVMIECEMFVTMKNGGQVIQICPKGRPNVI